MNQNDLALVRETSLFIAAESAFGVLADFTSANALKALGLPKMGQDDTYSDGTEIDNTRSVLARFRDKTPAGQWSFSTYCRPSGSLGVAPQEGQLWAALMGKTTISAGASVVYAPAMALPSFSLATKTSHTTSFVVGGLVKDLSLSVNPKGGLTLAWSGPCKKIIRAGKASLVEGSTTTVLSLEAGGAKLFDVGVRVQVGTETNTGSGYMVSDLDETADTITITPALGTAPDAGEVVEGYLPEPSIIGAPLPNRLARLTIDGVAVAIKEGSLTVSQEIKMIDDTVGDDDYPEGYIPGARSVEGSFTCYFLRPYLAHFRMARNQTPVVLAVSAGNVAGSRLAVSLGQAQINTPSIEGDLEVTESVSFKGLSTAGEDEVSASFT